MLDVRSRDTLQLNRRWALDPFRLHVVDDGLGYLHILENLPFSTAVNDGNGVCTHPKTLDRWWDVFALDENVVFLPYPVILFRLPVAYELWRSPTTIRTLVNLATPGYIYSYFVVNGSVYWIPFANSMSDASFLLLLIASKISASSSSAFSSTVFLASNAIRNYSGYKPARLLTLLGLLLHHILRLQ